MYYHGSVFLVSTKDFNQKKMLTHPGHAKLGADLKRIFKRFYRVPTKAAVPVKGTGLGLPIVRSIIEKHGGRIVAESKGEGKGTTFFIKLPIA
jgi:signal transduction histidine kinase